MAHQKQSDKAAAELSKKYKEVRQSLNELENYAHGLYVNIHDQFFLNNGKLNKKEVNIFCNEIVSISRKEKDFDNENSYMYFFEAIDLIMSYFEFSNNVDDQTFLGILEVYKYTSKYSINPKYKTAFEELINVLKTDNHVSKMRIQDFEKKIESLHEKEEFIKGINSSSYLAFYLKKYCINHGYSVINSESKYERFNRLIERNKKFIEHGSYRSFYSEYHEHRIEGDGSGDYDD